MDNAQTDTPQNEFPLGQYVPFMTLAGSIMLGGAVIFSSQFLKGKDSSNPASLPFYYKIGSDNVLFTMKQEPKSRFGAIRSIKIEITPQNDDAKEEIDLNKSRPSCLFIGKEGVCYSFRYKTQKILKSFWSNQGYLNIERAPYDLTKTPSDQDLASLKTKLQNTENLNILVLGKPNNGKTSFVNTLLQTCNNECIRVLNASQGKKHVTEEISIENLIGGVKVFDSPGWQNTHKFELIKYVLDGNLPNLTLNQMREKEDIEFSVIDDSSRIHRVILVVSATSSEEDHQVNKKILDQIAKAGFNYLLVITKVDCLRKANENSIKMKNYFLDPRVVHFCREMRELYGTDHILPMINYTNQMSNENSIDYVALKAIQIVRVMQSKANN